MAEKTVIISGEAQDVDRAIRELQANVQYERIPVTVRVKKDRK